MTAPLSIHWFKNDLRISDNPGLLSASSSGSLLPIYILDQTKNKSPGAASKWWLYHALSSLNESLEGKLRFFAGDPAEILLFLAKTLKPNLITFNDGFEPHEQALEKRIKHELKTLQINYETYNASLFFPPGAISKDDGSYYKVYTPFKNKLLQQIHLLDEPVAKPSHWQLFLRPIAQELSLEKLELLPTFPWDKKLKSHWQISEDEAQKKLTIFIKNALQNYKEARDFPKLKATSFLSPYLHFGQISVHQIYSVLKTLPKTENRDHFLSELVWREFAYQILHFAPNLPWKNWQEKFNNFPFIKNQKFLKAWQQGQTGFPIVDAGMRELWQTGYMHNRVRMITASFLIKNLLIDWREGEKWFWDCLVDADLASNSFNWQWVAGSGTDAAPFFRIFNPITQGEKFDKDGSYTKKYVPELKNLPRKFLFKPFEAPLEVLQKAKIVLGQDYPHPIVDLKFSRNLALEAYKNLS